MLEAPPPVLDGLDGRAGRQHVERNGALPGAHHQAVGMKVHHRTPAHPEAQRVVVAIGDERGHPQVDHARGAHDPVTDVGDVLAVLHPDRPLEDGVVEGERPRGDGAIEHERLDQPVAVRVDRAAGVLLRVEREGPASRSIRNETRPLDQPADQHRSADRRFERRDQQAVIAPARDARECPRCIAAEPIRDQPLATECRIEVAADRAAEMDERFARPDGGHAPGGLVEDGRHSVSRGGSAPTTIVWADSAASRTAGANRLDCSRSFATSAVQPV